MGIMTDLSPINYAIFKALGYRALVGDHFLSNIRSDRLSREADKVCRLPRTGYVVGRGWQDVEFKIYLLPDNVMSVAELKAKLWRRSLDVYDQRAKL